MSNFDVTEIGAIRVRSKRFLAQMNGTGPKLNFGLFFFFHFFPFPDFPNIFPYFSYHFPPKITPNITTIVPVLGGHDAASSSHPQLSRATSRCIVTAFQPVVNSLPARRILGYYNIAIL